MKHNMNENERKADQYMKDAQNKCNAFQSLFAFLGSNSSKIDEAIELYTRAGNSYKMAKNWTKAGNAFCCAATLHIRDKSKHLAAHDYVNAANCYKKSDVQLAIKYYNKAIEIYTETNRLTTAAKFHVTVAEIYERELVDVSNAMSHYETAANYYKCDESNASANRCLLSVAHFNATLGQYQKAIDIYEQIGNHCADSSLLKYSAKDHFFRATLCHICIDQLNGELALKRYEDIFPAFSDSRECKFVKKLLTNLEEQDVEGFTKTVKDFDTISRLEPWFVNILLKIKKLIDENELDVK